MAPKALLPAELVQATNDAISSAIHAIQLLQKVHEKQIRDDIERSKTMLAEERDQIIQEIRDSVKQQMDEAVKRLESRFDGLTDQGNSMFPRVPPLSQHQLVELQSSSYSAEKVVLILGEVLKRIPNTEDIIIPPEYIRHLLAKYAGIIA